MKPKKFLKYLYGGPKKRAKWNERAHRLIDQKSKISSDNRKALKRWENHAKAVLQIPIVREPIDCSHWHFPSTVDFSGIAFQKQVNFSHACFHGPVCFSNAIFHDTATFVGARFYDKISFNNSCFHDCVSFDGSEFRNDATFNFAEFKCSTRFNRASFDGRAFFCSTKFKKCCRFNMVNFNNLALFDNPDVCNRCGTFQCNPTSQEMGLSEPKPQCNSPPTIFAGDAHFDEATFAAATKFINTKFCRDATFQGINSKSTFTMKDVKFEQVPDFAHARFVQAPDFYASAWTKLAPTGICDKRAGPNRHKRQISRWQVLKSLAAQGNDYYHQLAFYRKCIQGKIRDHPSILVNCLRRKRFLDFCYEALSGCGQSVMRPIVSWAVLTVSFYAVYLLLLRCCCGFYCLAPLEYSILAGFPIIWVSASGRMDDLSSLFSQCDCGVGAIPYWLSAAHFLLASILFFFLFLALRNMFRMK